MAQFNRRDLLKVAGLALAGALFNPDFSSALSNGALEMQTDIYRNILLKAAVSPAWVDHSGWKRERREQYCTPTQIFQEAVGCCRSAGVEPRYIQHGNRINMSSTLFKSIEKYVKNASSLEYSGGLFNDFFYFANQVVRGQDIHASVWDYDGFEIPVIQELSPMASAAHIASVNSGEDPSSPVEGRHEYVRQITQLMNGIQEIVDKKGAPLSMGELVGYLMAKNKGDIMSGFYHATELCQFLTRQSDKSNRIFTGYTYEKVGNKWILNELSKDDFGTEKDQLGMYQGIFILSDLVEDQLSLLAPLQYLTDQYKNADQSIWLDNLLREKNFKIEQQTDEEVIRDFSLLSRYKDTALDNRGGIYHGLSIISMLALASPLDVQQLIEIYHLESINEINLNNLPQSFSSNHGAIKKLSDLNWAAYLPYLWDEIQKYN